MSIETGKSGEPKSGGTARYLMALIPLVVFACIALAVGKVMYDQEVHGTDISAIPSALIGTKAPALAMAPLDGSNLPPLTDSAIKGKLTLVNVFASWCIPCREEHPVLKQLAQDGRLNIVAINYKDTSENALRFLGELGNPYTAIGIDPNGSAAIDWGVYGIPESYLVAPDGTILYKQVGPFTATSLKEGLYPAMEKALGKPGA
ncbi:DsbE family thiol:disulfide interchange protein [Rhizobium rhizogenes]|uniref:DsbE family thiol:disulfide interchange protein n=1 Tax=Rhizobium rhizogenes TaxID=359 RepID=UPI0006489F73|nr:DsbE family thiol:disulfide interchange protein [Rhizobium rhizogenes]